MNGLPHPDNPFRIGDMVRLETDLKDGYGDTWLSKGDERDITSFADDGKGCFLGACGMGAHYSRLTPLGECKKRIEHERLITASKKAAAAFPTGHGV